MKFRIIPTTLHARKYWELQRQSGRWPFRYWLYEAMTPDHNKGVLSDLVVHLKGELIQ